MRKYTASTHTYVITAMFPFDSVLDYFCPILQVRPSPRPSPRRLLCAIPAWWSFSFCHSSPLFPSAPRG